MIEMRAFGSRQSSSARKALASSRKVQSLSGGRNPYVRKQAGASYGEVKRMVAAKWRGMSEKEKARWEAPTSAGANGELAEKRRGSRANRRKRRSVDQVCAETRQVGWLQFPCCVCAHA